MSVTNFAMNTRRGTITAKKHAILSEQPSPTMSEAVGSRPDECSDDDNELDNQIRHLSPESQAIVKTITSFITQRLTNQISVLKEEITNKDSKILELSAKVENLNCKILDLENHIDEVDQYQRRDCIILSGSSLPPELPDENPANVVINTIKDNLRINMSGQDISVAHRLGQKKQDSKRPIIVKLVNRSLKYDLRSACIQLKPELYINESLTSRRGKLLKQVLNIRRAHKNKFQQCYTNEGKITIKLRNSSVKHTINDEKSLIQFLDKYPEMMDTYIEIISTNQ